MRIENSTLNDIESIFELYRIATDFMKSKGQVFWPVFERDLVLSEIVELRQWKLLIEDEIACIWATTFNDELIWEDKSNDPALYIHRIATNPAFRGQKLTQSLMTWALDYAEEHQLDFIRLDTVGLNQRLIKHYEQLGFTFLGAEELQSTNGLPDHYKKGPVCYFEKAIID